MTGREEVRAVSNSFAQSRRLVHLAVLKAMYTRGWEVRMADVDNGVVMAHVPLLHAMNSGHVTALMTDVDGCTDLYLVMATYEKMKDSAEQSRRVAEDLLTSISVLLDPDWSDGSTLVSPPRFSGVKERIFQTPPPRVLEAPAPGPVWRYSSVTFVATLLFVMAYIMLFPRDIVEVYLPVVLVTPAVACLGAFLARRRMWRWSYRVFNWGGFALIVLLLLPTFGMVALLAFPFSLTGQKCNELMYWQDTYASMAWGRDEAVAT